MVYFIPVEVNTISDAHNVFQSLESIVPARTKRVVLLYSNIYGTTETLDAARVSLCRSSSLRTTLGCK